MGQSSQRIAIIGAGAAGLSAALALRDAGYVHVTVFESSARVGGKCRSLTYDGKRFDLGANYITSSYREVRALARRFRQPMFVEGPGHALDIHSGELRSLLRAATAQSGLFATAWAGLRFLHARWTIRQRLAPKAPGFAAAAADPDLCQPFADWLEACGLAALEPVFAVPITLMGYSKLSEIPAAYALTYMQPGTFCNLALFAAGLPAPLRRWPKRFVHGYESLMEAIATEVDVRRGVQITGIERRDAIRIRYQRTDVATLATEETAHEDVYDRLILACPLLPEVLRPMLPELADDPHWQHVLLDPYVVATYPAACRADVSAVSFSFPEPPLGQPYVVTQQFADVPLLSIYTRWDNDQPVDQAAILAANRDLLRKLGANDPDVEPLTFDCWPYFPHVAAPQFADFYAWLDSQQGVNRTYYVGGLVAFELVETIAAHARHIVETHFA